MKLLNTVIRLSVFFLIFSLSAVLSVSAQPPGGDTSGGQAGGQSGPMGQQSGPGGQMMQQDPSQMQQMMAQRYQQLLGMSDEEWAVIGPYVLKVSELSSATQSRSGMRQMMGRGNMQGASGQGQDQGQQPQSRNQSGSQDTARSQRSRGQMQGMNPSSDENVQALSDLLENENATTDEIKSKLSALRKAREASKRELAAAQKELRELLTLRQEATLVVMGLLE